NNLAFLAGECEVGIDKDKKLYFRAWDTAAPTLNVFVVGKNVKLLQAENITDNIVTRLIVKGGFVSGAGAYEYARNADGTDGLPDSQTTYGIITKRVTAPQFGTEADVQRWSIYKLDPICVPEFAPTVEVSNLTRLINPRGNARVVDADGTEFTEPIISVKYTLSGGSLQGSLQLGAKPETLENNLVGMIREARAKTELNNITTREGIFADGFTLNFSDKLKLYAKQERLLAGVMWDEIKSYNGIETVKGNGSFVLAYYDIPGPDFYVSALRKKDMTVLWTYTFTGGYSGIEYDNTHVYVSRSTGIYKLDILTGTLVDSETYAGYVVGSISLDDDNIYMALRTGTSAMEIKKILKSDLSTAWTVSADAANDFCPYKGITNDADNVYYAINNSVSNQSYIRSIYKTDGSTSWDTTAGGYWSDDIENIWLIEEQNGIHLFVLQADGTIREYNAGGDMWYAGALKNYGATSTYSKIARTTYNNAGSISSIGDIIDYHIDGEFIYLLPVESGAVYKLEMYRKSNKELYNSVSFLSSAYTITIPYALTENMTVLDLRLNDTVHKGLYVDYVDFKKYDLQTLYYSNRASGSYLPGYRRGRDGVYADYDVMLVADYDPNTETKYYISRDNGAAWAEATFTAETPLTTALTAYSPGDDPAAPYTAIDGTWKIRDDTGNAFRTEGTGEHILMFNRFYYNYYEIQAEVKNSTVTDKPNPGFIIGYADSDNYDFVYLAYTSNLVVYARKRNGVFELDVSTAAVALTEDTYYTLKVICKENTAYIYVEGTLYVTVNDLLGGGSAGLIAQDQTNATDYCYFKDITFTVYEKMWADLTGQAAGDTGKNIKIKIEAKPGANIRAVGVAF
ncbi:MAG: hypothetical protein UY48_C0046G0007, partial [Candidatus Gottesmanbacteria bacterium GW2011_GWB1_49_7]